MEQRAPGERAVLGRLRWRTRRGMRELDILLEHYLEEQYACACPAERAAFERLLEQPDADLYDWLLGRSEPSDQALARLVTKISTNNVGQK